MSWHRQLSGGLLLQFAAVSFVVVVCMGVALGWMLGRIVAENALTDAALEVRDVVSRRVMGHLSPGDLRSPMTGERYDAFQRLVEESVVSERTARIKLWSRDGTVIFSDNAALVGQRFPVGDKMAEALKGELAMELSNLQGGDNLTEIQFGGLLEVYVPIVFSGSSEVEGAFEVYQFYEPVALYVRASQRSLYITLAVGLLFIYGALVAVVKRGHDTISRQQKRLASLNRIATELSRCTTSSEVLSTGLRLAAESTGLVKGAIWLVGPSDRVELAAQRGFEEEEAALLSVAPVNCGAIRHALGEGRTQAPDRLHSRGRPRRSGEDNHAPSLAPAAPLLSRGSVLVAGGPRIGKPIWLAAPLLSRGSVLGALGLYCGSGRESIQADVQLAQAVAAELGVTLENALRYEEALYQADRDPVTGLLNHRAFHDCLGREFKRAKRAGRELSVVMIDLDGFKLFNDTYGHPIGDLVLREITALLSQNLRAGDLLGRYGGDEFVALLSETGTEGAMSLAERVLQAVAGHAFAPPDGPAVPIRLSLGLATYPQDARH
ncbi:MAG: sensor domain-containing diguanylate cyclase, partial [Dehalococcoidia bacterium]|nr:sensor domain-containing diguanylate cyclase [Dehalococcoidia bacterium]